MSLFVLRSKDFKEKSEELSRRLSLPLFENIKGVSGFVYSFEESGGFVPRLVLIDAEKPKEKLVLDFDEIHNKLLRQKSLTKTQLLAKAIGYKGKNLKIFDLTAGLGRDLVFFLALDCQVTAVERSPFIFELLSNAADRQKELTRNLTLINADSQRVLYSLDPADYPEVIYLDPMYPQRTKSALPKKEMVLLQKLVGQNETGSELLQIAPLCCQQRVVVKRPLKGEILLEGINHSFVGKTVRYDMYLPQRG